MKVRQPMVDFLKDELRKGLVLKSCEVQGKWALLTASVLQGLTTKFLVFSWSVVDDKCFTQVDALRQKIGTHVFIRAPRVGVFKGVLKKLPFGVVEGGVDGSVCASEMQTLLDKVWVYRKQGKGSRFTLDRYGGSAGTTTLTVERAWLG